jgi:hypothetical protein
MSMQRYRGVVMVPPIGFVATAVTEGLALVLAEEALIALEAEGDLTPTLVRKRHDSGVIDTSGWHEEAPRSVPG